jgi:hypothetical protein
VTIQLADPAVEANLTAAGLKPGQAVRVKLAEANPVAGQIRFELA